MCVTIYPFWCCCDRYKIQRRSFWAGFKSSILRSDQTAIRYRPHPYGDPLLMEICGYPTRPMAEFGSAFAATKKIGESEFRGTDVVDSSGEVLEINWVWGKDQIPFLEKAAALYLVLDLQVFDVFWNMLGDGQQKTDFWNVNEFNNSSRSDQEPQKK